MVNLLSEAIVWSDSPNMINNHTSSRGFTTTRSQIENNLPHQTTRDVSIAGSRGRFIERDDCEPCSVQVCPGQTSGALKTHLLLTGLKSCNLIDEV